MIELACETDFVAKNEQFQTLAADIVAHVGELGGRRRRRRCSAETLADGKTVAREHRRARPRSSARSSSCAAAVVLDGHRSRPTCTARPADLPPQVGVLVAVHGRRRRAPRAARRCRSPRCGRSTSPATRCPADVVENERRIAEATAREEGKPEAALPKIVEGRRQRLLQGRRAARAGVGAGQQEDASRQCSTRPA